LSTFPLTEPQGMQRAVRHDVVLHPAGRDQGQPAGGGAEEPGPRDRPQAAGEASSNGGEAGDRGGEEDEIHLSLKE